MKKYKKSKLERLGGETKTSKKQKKRYNSDERQNFGQLHRK